jgi:hypothetical protein
MMWSPLIAIGGRVADMATTFIGLTYFGLSELNPVALTPLGFIFGLAPPVCFYVGEWAASRWGLPVSLVRGVSVVTWGAALWNLGQILLVARG